MASQELKGIGSNGWRLFSWGMAALLLLAPLVAMQFTEEVNWSVGDFVIFAVILLGVLIPLELVMRRSNDSTYRWAAGLALLAAFLLTWISLGVGIIGKDGDPANLMYAGVLAVGILGVLMSRGEARGMTRTMVAVAGAQVLVWLFAVMAGLGQPYSGPLELTVLNGFFVALFLWSAWLFNRAAGPAGAIAH